MNINKAFSFFSFFTFHFPFSYFFFLLFLMVLFISVTVRCSRQQLLTAVGLSQRGVREGGREGAGRGPSSSPLLLLFCCFSAAPSLARSLARSICKDPEERQQQQQEGASGRRAREKNYNKASFCSLASALLLSCSENSNPCKSFFSFFLWWCHFFHRLERLVCLCLCFARLIGSLCFLA